MKHLRLFLLLISVAFATGCPNEPSRNFEDSPTMKGINAALNSYLIDLEHKCECYAAEQNPTTTDGKRDCTGSNPEGPRQAKIYRNQALEKVMAMADDNYQGFITAIETRRSRTEFVADVVDLGMGAATGIIKGKQRTIQIIGIALTAFRGVRKSEDLNFYKQQTTPILIAKMDDNRSKVEAIIEKKKDRTIEEYSMPEAIRDMVAYYNAGTLVRAFTELAKDTSKQASDSADVVRHVTGTDVKASDIPSIDRARIIANFGSQMRALEGKISEAQKAADAVQDATQKESKLKPVRDKLNSLWKAIEADDKFKPAIEKLKADPKFKSTIEDIDSDNPQTVDSVTPKKYHDLLIALNGAIAGNTDLHDDLAQKLQDFNK